MACPSQSLSDVSHPLSLPADWTGYEHLLEQVASELQNDKYSLKQMALTCDMFCHAAQRFLFNEASIMDDHDVYNMQIRLASWFAYHGAHSPPPFLQFMRELSFNLSIRDFHDTHIVDFLDLIKPALTGIRTIQVYGLVGLVSARPTPDWFQNFIVDTKPMSLYFNGMFLPRYILDLIFPSVKFLHFNVCRVYDHDGAFDPCMACKATLDIKLVLDERNEGWNRVTNATSSSVNSELLRVLDKAPRLESLSFRMAFGEGALQKDVHLPSGLRKLCVQIPTKSIILAPKFLMAIIPHVPSIEQIDLYYEIGWRQVLGWNLICKYTLDVILDPEAPNKKLNKINFLFGSMRNMRYNEEIEWATSINTVDIQAQYQTEGAPCLPIPMYYVPRLGDFASLCS